MVSFHVSMIMLFTVCGCVSTLSCNLFDLSLAGNDFWILCYSCRTKFIQLQICNVMLREF